MFARSWKRFYGIACRSLSSFCFHKVYWPTNPISRASCRYEWMRKNFAGNKVTINQQKTTKCLIVFLCVLKQKKNFYFPKLFTFLNNFNLWSHVNTVAHICHVFSNKLKWCLVCTNNFITVQYTFVKWALTNLHWQIC